MNMLYCQNIKCLDPFINSKHEKCPHCGSNNLSPNFHQYYQVISLIDSGGFSKIYLAINTARNNQKCVIKQVNTKNYNWEQTKKIKELFDREIEQLKTLRHPQIPELYDNFQENERLYLVQEYIQGKTLVNELSEKELFSEQEIIDFLIGILPVLKYVHSHKIIHRDIKPENIIRRHNNGELVLVDFGSSKTIITSCTVLSGATIIGSPEYIAPEQLKGQPRYNSDLYSLGFTCLYLITGLNPFNLHDITESKYKWRDYLGDNKISQKLGNILDKLIEENFTIRYQSVNEVWQDLQEIVPENLEEIGGVILSQPNTKQLVEIARISVPLLEIKFNGETIGGGSSFLYKQIIDHNQNLSKCYFFTNLHIISTVLDCINLLNKRKEKGKNIERDGLKIIANWQDKEFNIEQILIPKNTLIELEKNNSQVQHLDFATFCLEIANTEKLSFFGITEKSDLEIGEKIYAFGYPEGLNFSITDGIVSQIYSEAKQGAKITVNQWSIQHNMLINHGNSGGPTITEMGELIGISTWGINSSVAVGINFSLDIHQIINYMNDPKNMQLLDVNIYNKNLKKCY